jgi:cytochrome P450
MSESNGAATLPPGPSLPMVAQTARWIVRPTAFMDECLRRYGDIFTLRIAREGTWVLLADPEAIKQVFTGNPERLHAGEANAILGPLVGVYSVLLLDGPRHMRQRKLMLPPFHGQRMQRYGELMSAVAGRELDRFPRGTPFGAWRHMQAITLEIIIRAVFGVDDAAEVERVGARIRPLIDLPANRVRWAIGALLGPERLANMPGSPLARVLNDADEVLYAEIRDRRGDPTAADRDDILSMLLQARDEDGEAMSDEELRDELMTLLVAGHETTATALSWTLERLVREPAVLARLREEVDAGKEEYLDAVVHETLRLRPILPLVVRRLKAPMELKGYRLPAGTTVAPCIYLTHRLPDVYRDPHAFRPERFLEQPPGTYTWIPFGGGVRRCLGASFALFEMKVVLREVVRRFELRAPDARPERVRRRTITLSPNRGAELIVADRAAAATPGGREREAVAA